MTDTHILYNDRCGLCRAEIAHYRARAEAAGAPIRFEDLHRAGLETWGLTADQAKRRMHARLPSGEIVSGVAAFEAVWRVVPGYGWLARAVRWPLVRPAAAWTYDRILAPALYRRFKRREAAGLVGEDRAA